MKKLLVLAALVLGLLASTAGSAGAVGWPASCQTLLCVDSHLNALHRRDARLQARISALQLRVTRLERYFGGLVKCIEEGPLTQYGDPNGTFGYAFSNNGTDTFFTTGLDWTASGDPVDGWVMIDGCNTSTTAKPALGRFPLFKAPTHAPHQR